jgi:hypothetical protein
MDRVRGVAEQAILRRDRRHALVIVNRGHAAARGDPERARPRIVRARHRRQRRERARIGEQRRLAGVRVAGVGDERLVVAAQARDAAVLREPDVPLAVLHQRPERVAEEAGGAVHAQAVGEVEAVDAQRAAAERGDPDVAHGRLADGDDALGELVADGGGDDVLQPPHRAVDAAAPQRAVARLRHRPDRHWRDAVERSEETAVGAEAEDAAAVERDEQRAVVACQHRRGAARELRPVDGARLQLALVHAVADERVLHAHPHPPVRRGDERATADARARQQRLADPADEAKAQARLVVVEGLLRHDEARFGAGP